MNTPPGYNQQPNVPQGYGQPQGYPPPQGYQQPMPQSHSYMPPPQHPHGFRGATRQFFNPATYRQPGTGAFGTASLILSLVSIVLMCGLLSPISLVLGFVGLIGQKTHKGAALAGVLISILPALLWAGVFAFGLHHAMYTEKYAAQAGGPVIAAVEEYKKDHGGKVPASLDALVSEGLLPARWTAGLDDLDSPVKSVVEGKAWSEFLRYTPIGGSVSSNSSRRERRTRAASGDDWVVDGEGSGDLEPAPEQVVTSTVYTLVFIGVDGNWSTTDDTNISLNPDKKYDLSVLGGSNTTAMRQLAQTKRKLEAAQSDATAKIDSLKNIDLPKAEKRLAENEKDLKSLARQKALKTPEKIRADKDCSKWLKVIGQEIQVIAAINNKINKLLSSLNDVKVSLRSLESQEAMAKLADNKAELAELNALLEQTTKELTTDATTEFMGDESGKEKAANDWLREQFPD